MEQEKEWLNDALEDMQVLYTHGDLTWSKFEAYMKRALEKGIQQGREEGKKIKLGEVKEIFDEGFRSGIEQGKREAWADVKKHLDETSADLSGSCYEPGLDLASRMVEEKLSSLDNPSKG